MSKPQCQYAPTGQPNEYRCPVCGHTVTITGDIARVHRDCKPPPTGQEAANLAAIEAGPSASEMAWNLAKSLMTFVSGGCKLVTAEEYAKRLTICDVCVPPEGFRVGTRCRHKKCGCFLAAKARGRAFHCPIGKW